jgi:hypothetical protein
MTGPLLVVSAHATDFVWRCGGYIAKTTSAGGAASMRQAEAYQREFPQVVEVLA